MFAAAPRSVWLSSTRTDVCIGFGFRTAIRRLPATLKQTLSIRPYNWMSVRLAKTPANRVFLKANPYAALCNGGVTGSLLAPARVITSWKLIQADR